MNVCVVCGGDGVLFTAGHWYCINHLDEGFIATAALIARLQGRDDVEAMKKAEDWVQEL